MTSTFGQEVSVGRYGGLLAENYRFPEFVTQLQDLGKRVDEAWQGQGGPRRNRNVRLTFTSGGSSVAVAVKAFGRQLLAKDWLDTFQGSRARRSWQAACHLRDHGVGTPPPVGFLERWDNGRLAESYFLAEYQDETSNLKDELIQLYHEEPECEKFMSLLECVAGAVWCMHETGFQHNDLGNQNILLKRLDKAVWGGVQFIDLNRARIREHLSVGDRARDISRLYLPSDFMRIFEDMYYRGARPPNEFREAVRIHRRRYGWHAETRAWRHPIRAARIREAEKGTRTYPSEKDMWVWDWKSAQAISVMRPKDRSRYYPARRFFQVAQATVAALFPVWRRYEDLLDSVYKAPVVMQNRVGVAINPDPEALGRELEFLRALGKIPVFVRFYHHERETQWKLTADVVRNLHREGHAVSIALVQDRRAVTEPERWKAFVSSVLDQVHDEVEYVEVGHAINRVKWGIWDFEEHRRLMEAAAAAAARHPGTRLTGPAVIDFEYPDVVAVLRNLPPAVRFAALSHHLYVDRRGAPESHQGMFAALEKFALAKAIAQWSGVCGDKVIVSEVSWPLAGTGVFSPVTSPYDSPGPRHNDPSVSEDDYADYMLRYLLIALCSGMIDRVFWWRLTARGFGLIDETDIYHWRERPAYQMLQYFLAAVGGATFVEKPDARRCVQPEDLRRADGVHLFLFQRPEGDRVCLAYSAAGPMDVTLPFEYGRIRDALGKIVRAREDRRVSISGRPVYVFVR